MPEAGPSRQQIRRRNTEGCSDHDEIVDVAAPMGALRATERSVGHRAAHRGAAGGQLVLGEAERQPHALDGAGGMQAGGAYFERSSCHNR